MDFLVSIFGIVCHLAIINCLVFEGCGMEKESVEIMAIKKSSKDFL